MSFAVFLKAALPNDYSTVEFCTCILAIRNEKSQFSEVYSVKYLLNPWSRVLLEELTDSQLFKKFPAPYGTRRFISAFVCARHQSVSKYQSKSEAFCVNIS